MKEDSVKPKRPLGGKGARTRAHLLAVTRELLETFSPVQLTSAAITQEAKISAGTFYIYFTDVQDILYSLAVEAHEALTRLYEDHPEWFRDSDKLYEHAEEFVLQSDRVWTDYSHILLYRNLEADLGNERFRTLRNDTALPMVGRIATAIEAGNPGMKRKETFARAVVLIAALDRICAVKYHYLNDPDFITTPAELSKALAQIMVSQFGRRDHPVAGG